MSKFWIECPNCHRANEASTGMFRSKSIRCACGFEINIKTDSLTSRRCPHCGNDVVFDQRKAADAKCPYCQKPLMAREGAKNMASFACPTCGCSLQINKSTASMTCPVCEAKIDVARQLALLEERAKMQPLSISYGGDKNTLVWKHPLTDFVTGSQLIVHESQEAIFFRDGMALDSFPSGRYSLETSLLPKARLPANGQPFRAEVYFVNLVTLMGIKWGTNRKISVLDVGSGLHVELGASGSFNLKVQDARRLVLKVVGSTNELKQQQLFGSAEGVFRTMVMTHVRNELTKIIMEHEIDVLELDAHIDEISRALKVRCNEDLEDYGLYMPEFYVLNIVTPTQKENPEFFSRKKQHDQETRLKPAKPSSSIGWHCACGERVTGRFCGVCGARMPENAVLGWDCACGQKGLGGSFCTNCGEKAPAANTIPAPQTAC